MFGAIRDCAPQLLSARHADDPSAMMETFKKDIMDTLKEVCVQAIQTIVKGYPLPHPLIGLLLLNYFLQPCVII